MGCFTFLSSEKRDSYAKSRKISHDRESKHGVEEPGKDSIPENRQTSSDLSSNTSAVGSEGGVLDPSGLKISKPHNLRCFTFSELKAATKNFHRQNLLGEGGFGCVYKGWLKQKSKYEEGDEKLEVAVKQLNRKGAQGHKEWLAEVHFLGLVDCPYLVKLIGYCAEDDDRGIQRLLVYEFMPNKSLDEYLFSRGPQVLSWQLRVQIALGAAHGLAYLHEEMKPQVIFRDFKTSNVLLDDEFHSKLSDFGLARQGPEMGNTHVTTAVVGTVGYAAPEYIQTGHLTAKSDVWSFGIVMLEMLTGRKALERNRPKCEQRLLDWVKPFVGDSRKIWQIMDPQLKGRYPVKPSAKFALIASQCLVKQPRGRPKMSQVVEGLEFVLANTYLWEAPTSHSPLRARRISAGGIRPLPSNAESLTEGPKLSEIVISSAPSATSSVEIEKKSAPG